MGEKPQPTELDVLPLKKNIMAAKITSCAVPTALQCLSGLVARALLREARRRGYQKDFGMGNGWERDNLDEPWQFALSDQGQTPFVGASFYCSTSGEHRESMDNACLDRVGLFTETLRSPAESSAESPSEASLVDCSLDLHRPTLANELWHRARENLLKHFPTTAVATRTEEWQRWDSALSKWTSHPHRHDTLLLAPDDFFATLGSIEIFSDGWVGEEGQSPVDRMGVRKALYFRAKARAELFAAVLADLLESVDFTPVALPPSDLAWSEDALATEEHFAALVRRTCYLNEEEELLRRRKAKQHKRKRSDKTPVSVEDRKEEEIRRSFLQRCAQIAPSCHKIDGFVLKQGSL